MSKNKIKSNKQSGGKIWVARLLLMVFMSLFLGVNFYLWNATSLMRNQMPMPFGYGISVVLSGSMEPALSVDDLVFIKETQDVDVGDIIVYQSGHSLVIHRVVQVEEDTIYTQGDANNAMDAPIDRSDVKGRMIGHIPYVGAVTYVLKNPVVIVAMICACFVLLERSYRQEQEEEDQKISQIKEEIERLKRER
jgi:signal peptidase